MFLFSWFVPAVLFVTTLTVLSKLTLVQCSQRFQLAVSPVLQEHPRTPKQSFTEVPASSQWRRVYQGNVHSLDSAHLLCCVCSVSLLCLLCVSAVCLLCQVLYWNTQAETQPTNTSNTSNTSNKHTQSVGESFATTNSLLKHYSKTGQKGYSW